MDRMIARYVVRESDLKGMDWSKRSRIIEDAQRSTQWSIGHQIVQTLLEHGNEAHVSLQYSVHEEKGGTEVVIAYQAIVQDTQ